MLKVLVADDEKKLCRLIEMLCNWDSLGMEIIGFAHNGPDTIRAIQEKRPDILIVDIRMPGCDGIEVIEKGREMKLLMEVIIVSGYADFAYAKAAISQGVSGYLLKPIKKTELEEALRHAKHSIEEEKKRIAEGKKLCEYIKDENMKRRHDLILDLPMSVSFGLNSEIESVNEQYHYHFQPGYFQFLVLSLLYSMKKYDKKALQKTLDGFEAATHQELSGICYDYEICMEENRCYVLCNYGEDKEKEFRKSVRAIVNKLSAKKFEMWKMTFSAALGKKVQSPVYLWDSLESAQEGLKEAILEGCEKLLEFPESPLEGRDWSLVIARFNNEFDKAIDLCDEQMTGEAVERLKDLLSKEKDILGRDYNNIVSSLGIHAMTKSGNENEEVTGFSRRCELCYDLDELFAVLRNCLNKIIHRNLLLQKEDGKRPIRVAKQYMQTHYMEGISLEEIARIAGFSPGYFSSLMKREMGIGFSEYLIQLRMEKAKELLKGSNKNIKDICGQVGYSDLKHFNALFKKYTGIKPGEYRKLYG